MHSNCRFFWHDSWVGTDWQRFWNFALVVGALVIGLGVAVPSPVGAQDAGAGLLPAPIGEPISDPQPEQPPDPDPVVDPIPDQPATAGVRDSVVRLYSAVFARNPDPDGQSYWVTKYVTGTSLPKIATLFIESPEWVSTYGEVANRRFVELLYNNVLDRQPDSGGWDYWAGLLDTGTPRSSVLLGFSESPEFVTATGTASPTPPPLPSIPANSGAGRRIVYSNSGQRIWMINADETIHNSYLVSGKKNDPVAGTYHVYSKSPKAWAGHAGITMEHMVRFAWGRRLSIGFHAIPHYGNGQPMQEVDELGTYQSAGCVRQRDDLALALYHWTPVGTLVMVLP